MIDFIELSDTYSMVEIIATKKIKNKTIKKLDLRSKYGCTIIGIQREEDFIISPLLDEVIHEGDTLVIVGKNEEIKRFEKYGV